MKPKILLIMLGTTLALAIAGKIGSQGVPPEGPIQYGDYTTEDLVELVGLLNQFHRHSEAVEAGFEALSRDLTSTQDAFVRHKMGQSYEFIPDSGPLAKAKYTEVLELHPDYNRIIEIAFRLGELNDSIIIDGTERNVEQAIADFEYVLNRCDDPNEDPRKVYYIALKAHMGLGNLRWDQKSYAAAKEHFEVIYHCDPNLAEPLPCEKFEKPEDLAKHKTWLKNRILSMKDRVPPKLVGLCIRPDPVESMNELDNLITEYVDDATVVELAREAYNQVCAVDEMAEDAIRDFE